MRRRAREREVGRVFRKRPEQWGNKRAARRVPTMLRVEFSFGGGVAAGYSTNISEGGLFLQANDPMPPGRRLFMRVQLPGGGTLAAVGQIAWTQVGNGVALMPGAGVRFVQMTDGARQQLGRFLADYQG
jgi:uncharacterized protein (TIGR02266 family)